MIYLSSCAFNFPSCFFKNCPPLQHQVFSNHWMVVDWRTNSLVLQGYSWMLKNVWCGHEIEIQIELFHWPVIANTHKFRYRIFWTVSHTFFHRLDVLGTYTPEHDKIYTIPQKATGVVCRIKNLQKIWLILQCDLYMFFFYLIMHYWPRAAYTLERLIVQKMWLIFYADDNIIISIYVWLLVWLCLNRF